MPRTVRPVADRFWEKVRKSDHCWEWTGCLDTAGYGQIRVDGRLVMAHRLSLEIHGVTLQPGQFACHTCDNPRCVRPDHLYAGSRTDNYRDMVDRGRESAAFRNATRLYRHLKSGELHPRAKLTEADVRTIRARRAAGAGIRELAREYGMGHTSIRHIVLRQTWPDVD